jgi:hypothetical protein
MNMSAENGKDLGVPDSGDTEMENTAGSTEGPRTLKEAMVELTGDPNFQFNDAPPKDLGEAVQQVAGGIAMYTIVDHLLKGGSVNIPSLGITITKDDFKKE